MTSRIGAAVCPTTFAFALAAMMNGAVAALPSYQLQLLPVPGSGSFAATATSINNQGVVGVNRSSQSGGVFEVAAYRCTQAQCDPIPRLHDNPSYPHNTVEALNDDGVATGSSDDVQAAHHAYTFDGTTLAGIPGFADDDCGGCTMDAYGKGINASGHVVGYGWIAKGRQRAFLYRDGVMLEIGRLGGHNSDARGINAADEVVGASQVGLADGEWMRHAHAFLYRNGRTKDLGTLGGSDSAANAINDRGHIVGWATDSPSGGAIPFLYKQGRMAALPLRDGEVGRALGLNGSDWVVGTAQTAGGKRHAFLYDGKAVHDLNGMLSEADRAHWLIEEAVGINDLGQMAVNGRDRSSGEARAFLFSPVKADAPR